VLLVPGLLALRGRWHLLRDNAGLITIYGISAVAGAQLCYFYAVTYMQVSVALLLEYTAPVAVVIWLWLRHGHRPSGLTVLGAAIAAAGLVLVLDVVSGAELSTVAAMTVRTVTAAPALQPVSSSPRASTPDRPNDVADATARSSPVACRRPSMSCVIAVTVMTLWRGDVMCQRAFHR
jgi:hypothetical protein